MSTSEIDILKINHVDREASEITDVVAVDESFCIFLNGEHFRVLLATPELLEELVVGHLFTESVINSTDEIVSLEIRSGKAYVELKDTPDILSIQQNRIDVITTACGLGVNLDSSVGSLTELPKGEPIDCDLLKNGIQELNKHSRVFKETGGTHSAILLERDGTVVQFAEDVGRHNAVDKTLGSGLKANVDFSRCVLVVSGRLSAEMVLKAARAGVPIVGSISAPLQSGIRVAEAAGLTLVGFIRGRRMNIYTSPDRITID